MGAIPFLVRVGAILWSLVVLLSIVIFSSSAPRAENVKEASLALGGTIAQAVFNVIYWVLAFTLLPKLLAGPHAKAYEFLFAGIAFACFLRQGVRLVKSLGQTVPR